MQTIENMSHCEIIAFEDAGEFAQFLADTPFTVDHGRIVLPKTRPGVLYHVIGFYASAAEENGAIRRQVLLRDRAKSEYVASMKIQNSLRYEELKLAARKKLAALPVRTAAASSSALFGLCFADFGCSLSRDFRRGPTGLWVRAIIQAVVAKKNPPGF